MLALALLIAAAAANVPELPKDIPASAAKYTVTIMGTTAGQRGQEGTASWKSKAEQGSRKLQGPAFYVAMYGAPVDFAPLLRAALDRGGSLPLLPDGEARVQKVRDLSAHAEGKSQPVALSYRELGVRP